MITRPARAAPTAMGTIFEPLMSSAQRATVWGERHERMQMVETNNHREKHTQYTLNKWVSHNMGHAADHCLQLKPLTMPCVYHSNMTKFNAKPWPVNQHKDMLRSVWITLAYGKHTIWPTTSCGRGSCNHDNSIYRNCFIVMTTNQHYIEKNRLQHTTMPHVNTGPISFREPGW